MILKLIIRNNNKLKRNKIYAWIQKHKDYDKDILDILKFFKDQVTCTLICRINKYYKITSDNPAIMLSLISSIQEIIAESCFNTEEPIDLQESVNSKL